MEGVHIRLPTSKYKGLTVRRYAEYEKRYITFSPSLKLKIEISSKALYLVLRYLSNQQR